MAVASQSYASNGLANYPNPSIDPRKKGFDWILQYCRAAYSDSRGYTTFGSLNIGNLRMSEIKLYTLGKQPVDKYKKMFNPGEPQNESWRAIDWTVPAFLCKYRNIAISKLLQKKFDFQAYAIDPVAKSEEDAWYNRMRVKILMRDALRQAGSDLADTPGLAPEPGEPEDMEQLAIQKEFTYKHAMAMEAEKAIALAFSQNNIDEIEKEVTTDLYDYGVGAITQWLDENGKIKMRRVNMEYFGCSYCEKPDFSDMTHWFEIVPTYVADLAPYFTKEQLDDICKKAAGRNGNPVNYTPFNGIFNQSWSQFKVMVMHIKFLSYNDTIYKEEKDRRDNIRFGKSSYNNIQFIVNKEGELQEEETNQDNDNYFAPIDGEKKGGEPYPKYIKNTVKVSYKSSWIVDTEYMYNYGLRENQNRKLASWWDTDLDIQMYGWNFYKMQFSGMTEQLIPFEDRACMLWFNLQNLSNKLLPYLINMDMTTIEGSFAFGKGGSKGTPAEVMDFIWSNLVVPYRSGEIHQRNPNYKPISIEATGQLAAFAQLHEELEYTLLKMQQVAGLNEATDASTVNAKNLTSTNAVMVESTNNALYLISEAKRDILKRTADACIQKTQIAVQLGKVEGYAKALGQSVVEFFRIDPRISMHDLGIFVVDALTESQREALWKDATLKESQGLLTIGDKYFIMSVRSLKEAYALLDYKIEKRKQEAQQFELQKIQEASAGNEQLAITTARLELQKIASQGEVDMELLVTEKMWEMQIEIEKKKADFAGEQYQSDARVFANQIQSEAKIIASSIAAKSSVEKQFLANKKPKPKVKS